MATMRAVTARLTEDRATLGTNRNVREAIERWLPSRAPNTWASEFLYGIEKREDLAASTKVNMVLHQDGHTHIYNDDALAPLDDIADRHREEKFRTHHSSDDGQYKFPVAETMDVVITNPPFSLTLDAAVQADLASTFSLAGERNSENLFVERWFQLLGEGGRLGAVLPESFFSTAENETARRFLFAHFHVRAIVSLPPHAFQPWTPTRTSLLFAKRKTNREIARWNTTYSKHESDLQASLGVAKRSVTRLLNPQEGDTEASLGKVTAQLSKHLRDLDVAATHDVVSEDQ
jgi:type I restriction enzyme M protein